MAFTDTFTDTNGTALESHTPSGGTAWTLVSGSAGSLKINTNQLQVQAATQCVYTCDNQGSTAPYVQAIQARTGNNLYSNTFVCIRLQDGSNFVGFRQSAFSVIAMSKNVAGTVTDLVTTTPTAGNTYKVSAPSAGGSTVQFFENGTQVGTDQTVSNFTSVTAMGVVSADTQTNAPLDNFEAGANAVSSGTTIKTYNGFISNVNRIGLR